MKVLSTLKNTVRDVAWKASGLGELGKKKCFLPSEGKKVCHTVLKKTRWHLLTFSDEVVFVEILEHLKTQTLFFLEGGAGEMAKSGQNV